MERSKTIPPQDAVYGFDYEISQEQWDLFQKMTPLQRLRWAEDARLFTLMGQTAKSRAYHQQLRRPTVNKD